MPTVYDHYRPVDDTDAAEVVAAGATDEFDPGIYRVVGIDDERVTLLRVTDGDGRRAATGHLERVPRSTLDRAFEPAADPDAGLDRYLLVAVGVAAVAFALDLFVPRFPDLAATVAILAAGVVVWLRR